ncbi:MAG: glycoside hydrolase [Rubrobacter sp.]|nr:glycoside hydrolase [Rubrobacter sp.]
MPNDNPALLIRRAKMVLDFNRVESYTQPGPRLYPHQWSWDSAFIAIGYARYDQDRAVNELNHLFDSQWKNGLLPQIVFNPDFSEYFPGVGFWHADRSPNAPLHHKTSGVVQPPIHATAALHIYRYAQNEARARAFLEKAFPRLAAWHEYLYRDRDPEGTGLAYIRHPWESGMDNSPMWDETMLRMHLRPDEIPLYQRADTHLVAADDRPVNAAYDRFAWLVQLFADRNYDEARIREDCPFLVQDVLFNTLLCQAGRDLSEIARVLGEDPSPFEMQATQTARAINEKLWDEERGIYMDYDVVTDEPIRVFVAAGFTPLYAGIPDEGQARRLLTTLESYGFSFGVKDCCPVPSYDRYGYGFSPVQYWRGPVWVNINWLLLRGLERYGFDAQANHLRRTTIELVREGGFYEYFHPTHGNGHGSDFFSWTAALLLDILLDGKKE